MSHHTKLRALICETAGTGTMDDMARRVAQATPPDQLAALYKAALHYAIEAIVDDECNAATDRVFGGKTR